MGSGRLRRKSQPRITTYCKRRDRFKVINTLESYSETTIVLIWEAGSTKLPGLIQTAITHEGCLRGPWRMDLWTSGAPRNCWMVKGMFFLTGTFLLSHYTQGSFFVSNVKAQRPHQGPPIQSLSARNTGYCGGQRRGKVLWTCLALVSNPLVAFHLRPQ